VSSDGDDVVAGDAYGSSIGFIVALTRLLKSDIDHAHARCRAVDDTIHSTERLSE
jgi:hypothetical protein